MEKVRLYWTWKNVEYSLMKDNVNRVTKAMNGILSKLQIKSNRKFRNQEYEQYQDDSTTTLTHNRG